MQVGYWTKKNIKPNSNQLKPFQQLSQNKNYKQLNK